MDQPATNPMTSVVAATAHSRFVRIGAGGGCRVASVGSEPAVPTGAGREPGGTLSRLTAADHVESEAGLVGQCFRQGQVPLLEARLPIRPHAALREGRDLVGELARGSYVGAVGGALDFVRAANASPGGVSIIALPAARVVEKLAGPVSVPRSEAGIVVTEHGAADLRGCTLRERERRMRAIGGKT
jgi:hypothetical protein